MVLIIFGFHEKIFDCLCFESDGPKMFLLVERFQVTGRRGEEGLTNKPDTKQLFNTRNFNVSWKDMYGAICAMEGIASILLRTVSKIFCNFCNTL